MDITVKHIRKLESRIIRDIYKQYIKSNTTIPSYSEFKTKIMAKLRQENKTQEIVAAEEVAMLQSDDEAGINRCAYIIMDKNRNRRCKNKVSSHGELCSIHYAIAQ